MSGTVVGAPKLLLRLEALLVVSAASVAYARVGASWWVFAALLLAPDLSMLGYLFGRRAGAALYNVCHWYGVPAAFIAWGFMGQASHVLAIGLIWTVHIGMDRALGYGLKYADGFGATHLGLVGQARGVPQCSSRSEGVLGA